MQIPRHIFKAYDIRGLAEEEITPNLARAIGEGFTTLLSKEKEGSLTVVVGRDMRQTSKKYQQEVIKGLVESGVKVLDIGLVSTPAFYFGVGYLEADGGIMVSASHNPAEYNGFKLTRAKAVPISGETGMYDLADIIEKEEFVLADSVGSIEVFEGIPEKDVEFQIDYAGEASIGTPKIVTDTANSMGAQYLGILFEKLGIDFDKLYWELDGTFPNHEADPLKLENMVDLQNRVKETGADFGIATDGDGDRIFFVDNEGEVVPPAIVRGILAQAMLQKFPGSTVCYDIRPGKITEDMILEAGGELCVTRVGHSLIKEKMKKVDAVYGGEGSGHFFYKFDTGTYEGPVVAALQIMQSLHASGKTLAEFIAPMKRYVHSGELNFKVEDKQATMDRIKKHFQDGELNELDGVSVSYPDFWFNVRPSNTEPVLRLALEALDQETMEKRRVEVIDLIEHS